MCLSSSRPERTHSVRTANRFAQTERTASVVAPASEAVYKGIHDQGEHYAACDGKVDAEVQVLHQQVQDGQQQDERDQILEPRTHGMSLACGVGRAMPSRECGTA